MSLCVDAASLCHRILPAFLASERKRSRARHLRYSGIMLDPCRHVYVRSSDARFLRTCCGDTPGARTIEARLEAVDGGCCILLSARSYYLVLLVLPDGKMWQMAPPGTHLVPLADSFADPPSLEGALAAKLRSRPSTRPVVRRLDLYDSPLFSPAPFTDDPPARFLPVTRDAAAAMHAAIFGSYALSDVLVLYRRAGLEDGAVDSQSGSELSSVKTGVFRARSRFRALTADGAASFEVWCLARDAREELHASILSREFAGARRFRDEQQFHRGEEGLCPASALADLALLPALAPGDEEGAKRTAVRVGFVFLVSRCLAASYGRGPSRGALAQHREAFEKYAAWSRVEAMCEEAVAACGPVPAREAALARLCRCGEDLLARHEANDPLEESEWAVQPNLLTGAAWTTYQQEYFGGFVRQIADRKVYESYVRLIRDGLEAGDRCIEEMTQIWAAKPSAACAFCGQALAPTMCLVGEAVPCRCSRLLCKACSSKQCAPCAEAETLRLRDRACALERRARILSADSREAPKADADSAAPRAALGRLASEADVDLAALRAALEDAEGDAERASAETRRARALRHELRALKRGVRALVRPASRGATGRRPPQLGGRAHMPFEGALGGH